MRTKAEIRKEIKEMAKEYAQDTGYQGFDSAFPRLLAIGYILWTAGANVDHVNDSTGKWHGSADELFNKAWEIYNSRGRG